MPRSSNAKAAGAAGRIGLRLRRTLRNLANRWREGLPPKPLIAANVLLGRDFFRLLPAQRQRFASAASLDRSIMVPARSLQLGMTGRYRRRSMVVSFADTKRWLRPIAALPTFAFIDETVRLGKSLQETKLYNQAMSGERVRRQHSTNGRKDRAQLSTEDDLARYYDRCMALAESIKHHGVVSLDSTEGSKFRTMDGEDRDIGVAIDESGRLVHYRRGKHRLAIAQALGLEHVPVMVHFISGPYLLRFIRRRDALWPGRLLAGIRKAVDHAVVEAQGLQASSPAIQPIRRTQEAELGAPLGRRLDVRTAGTGSR